MAQDTEDELDEAMVNPIKIARRLKLIARAARAGKLPSKEEFVACLYEIAADAMLAKRTYETENGKATYNAPERQHALRGIEIATHVALDPKFKVADAPEGEAPAEEARNRLRELGYELVKVKGPIASA